MLRFQLRRREKIHNSLQHWVQFESEIPIERFHHRHGAVEQCDTPDRIVMDPQTEYVRKFTEDIDRARVVHVRGLVHELNGTKVTGQTINGDQTIHDIARELVNDKRENIPVASKEGELIGVLRRSEALDLLLGDAK